MTDLNVALILRLVDRLSAPARRATRVVDGLGAAQSWIGKASGAAAVAVDRAARAAGVAAAASTRASAGARSYSASARLSATAANAAGAAAMKAATASTTNAGATRSYSASALLATTATTGFGQAVNLATASFGSAAEAARVAGQSAEDLGRNEDAAGRAAESTARRFGMLEKAQLRGRAAMRMMGGEIDKLDKQLGRLAMASLAVEGVAPAAHALSHLVGHSVGEAASFSSGMTGFGITAEMSDAQMAPIRAAILEASRRYALDPETALETFAFTRRSGVFRDPSQIITAGNEAARFQKLAERMKSPVTGEEVAGGASSFVREYGFEATPAALRRAFAMVDAAEKTGGGMTISDLLQYARSSGGQMKALGAGNPAALADVLAGEQLSMFLAHTGGQAGINFQDLLTQLAQTHTLRRYEKHGVNLEQVIKGAEARGISPVETIARVTQMMTGGDRFRIGELMINQQATQSMLALIQNMDKFRAYRNAIRNPSAVPQYNADVSRATSGPAASFERYRVAQMRIQIAMGTILLPIASRLADVLERIASAMSAVGERGGFLGKAVVFAVAGFAALLVGTVALGHALIGIAAPIMTIQFLTGKALPLSLTALRGQLAGLASKGLAVARTATASLGGALEGLAAGGLPAVIAGMRLFTGTVIANTVALLANPATWIFVAIAAAAVGAAILVRKYWQPITVFLGGVWSGLIEGLAPLAQAFAGVGRALAPMKPIWDAVASGVSAVWTWLTRLLTPVQLTGAQLRSTADAGRQFGLALAAAIRFVIGLPGRLFDVGRQMMQGLINGVLAMGPAAQRAIGGMADKVVSWFKERLGIHSPSTVFAELGDFTMQGFMAGVDRNSGAIAARFGAMARNAMGAARRGLAGAKGMFQGVLPGGRGPLGLRLNNPGNLRRWGANPVFHGFAAFTTAADGVRAMARQLQLYSGRGIDTVEGIVRRWAPPNENRTGAYVSAVAQRTGFAAHQRLNLAHAATMTAMIAAMIAQEQGRSPFSAAEIGAMIAPPAAQRAPADPVRLVGMPSRTGDGAHTFKPLAKPAAHTAHITNHFHITAPTKGGQVDHRKLAREIHDLQRRSQDAALHDGAYDE